MIDTAVKKDAWFGAALLQLVSNRGEPCLSALDLGAPQPIWLRVGLSLWLRFFEIEIASRPLRGSEGTP